LGVGRINLGSLLPQISRASRALGELSGIGRALANPFLLIRPFVRREAVASSRIEGTVTTLSQLLLFEASETGAAAPPDAREVRNYVQALETSLQRLDELPISARLLRDAHRTLLTGVAAHRGAHVEPGEFKREQNWIGARLIQDARFVPPPPVDTVAAMGELETYINTDHEDTIPLIVKLALVHYQFETIHPFADGNGRVGRLLIPLMLGATQQLSQPLLYLSPYLERNYNDYIDRMLAVSTRGEWHAWLSFFLTGVEETCRDTMDKARTLQDLQAQYHRRIQQARASALLSKAVDMLFQSPVLTVPSLQEHLDVTYRAAENNIQKLVQHGILEDAGLASRPRYWIAREIMDIIGV
jgi:Fic family protein